MLFETNLLKSFPEVEITLVKILPDLLIVLEVSLKLSNKLSLNSDPTCSLLEKFTAFLKLFLNLLLSFRKEK